MLSLLDAAALSVWPKARTPRLAEFLLAQSPETLLADPLIAALEFVTGAPADALAASLRQGGGQALERASKAGVEAVPWGDPRYPPLLATIPDPPVMLWIRGECESLRRPAVALVGSRGPSLYGLDAANVLAGELASGGITVVSGLARGIDSAAHRAALQAGGPTIAVLGSGVDQVYPAEHAALADSIARAGAVVSELPPGAPPRAFHFPARNRIISGLSLVIVVVEAAEQSGSLITAECAALQARDVLAVPGSIFSGRQAGCHALIRDGAGIAACAADVHWAVKSSHLRRFVGDAAPPMTLSDPLLDGMIPGEPYDIDALARQSGLAPAALLSQLLELELQGAVRRADGSRFVRVSRTC